mmetsp:Transcript_36829/g.78169  ORF Transcript_36829/g.78169 Transcript_36829/m.78169 type:complete len:716 (-) Transcript_36829:71-2218(-)
MATAEENPHEESIRVFCRFRPQNQLERDHLGSICVEIPDTQSVYVPNGEYTFNFDRVFGWDSSQREVYDVAAKPVIDSVLRGFNGTVFAYGQTSSGKTYTMEGPDIEDKTNQGVIPRMVWSIFDGIYHAEEHIEFLVKVSIVEIYNERIRDLLDLKKDNLKVHEDKARGVFIGDVTESYVGCEQEIFDTMRAGHYNRSMAVTNMNEHSSRSHLVFILTVEQKNLHDRSVKVGKLHLVDLAGSEKVAKTGATGDRLDEAKNINRSLSTLGLVINCLTDKKSGHTPYRDSKLTRVLQESLGGNAKTSLIITCSPSNFNEQETVGTLRFGQRAKMIKNVVKVNHERSAEELKLLLEKKEHTIAELRRRCAGLEQFLRTNGLAVPEAPSTLAASSPVSAPARQEEVDELYEQLQNEREKLQVSTEEIARLRKEHTHWRSELTKFSEEASLAKDKFEQVEYERNESLEEVRRLRQLLEKQQLEMQAHAAAAALLPTGALSDTCDHSGAASPQSIPQSSGSDTRTAEERLRDADRPLKKKVSQLDKNLEQLTVMYHKLVAQNSGLKVEVSENDKKIQRKDQRIAQLEKNLREAKQKYEKLLNQCASLSTAVESMGRMAGGANGSSRPRNLIRPMRGGTQTFDRETPPSSVSTLGGSAPQVGGGGPPVGASGGYPPSSGGGLSPSDASPATESPSSAAARSLRMAAVPPYYQSSGQVLTRRA